MASSKFAAWLGIFSALGGIRKMYGYLVLPHHVLWVRFTPSILPTAPFQFFRQTEASHGQAAPNPHDWKSNSELAGRGRFLL